MKLSLICLLCAVTVGIHAQNRTVIILDVKGQPGDSIHAVLAGVIKQKGIPTGPDGHFKFVFELEQPSEITTGILPNKNKEIVFIEPGDSLTISYDMHHKDSTLQFSGKGAANNQVFHEFNNTDVLPWEQLHFSPSTTANDFAAYLRRTHDNRLVLLQEKGHLLSPALKKHLEVVTYADYLYDIIQTPNFISRINKRKISESIPDGYWSFGKLFREDVKLLEEGTYVRLLSGGYPYFLFLKKQQAQHKLDDKLSPEEQKKQAYNLAKKAYRNPTVKSTALFHLLEGMINAVPVASTMKDQLDDYLTNYCKDPDARKSLLATYAKKTAISDGQIPPHFSLKDQQGHDVTLADFKGKVVYMDLWASWCGPCRAQMKGGSPGLHKQFEGNNDVVFLYISIDDSPDKWKKAIEEDKIEGIHLLSPGGLKSTVAQLFSLQGIPRYMLIGKDGKIFNNDATRPSQPETAETIRKLLSM